MKQKGYNPFMKIRYYLNVWIKIVQASLSRAVAYRLEVIARTFRGVFLVAVQIIFLNAIAGSSKSFAGWTIDQLYLITGIFNLITYTAWATFSINLWRLEEKLMKGEFDFILLKPMSSIFGASFTEFFIDDFMSVISGIILIGYYIAMHWSEIPVYGYFATLFMIIIGILLWYSWDLIISSFDFFILKNGFRSIKEQFNSTARFPTGIWSSNLQVFFYVIFPAAFMGTVPAQFLIGNISYMFLVYGFVLAIIFLFIARSIWNLCIRNYTSVG
ncbi:MAG TPA: ABC-2 family transporter protein [Candidatus Dojkabacteria bacterium]|nr:ABC-2 family transporter protein [Candidatus Dojkabacteria bacterium]